MADKVYKNGVSIDILVNMQTDITGASATVLLVRKPDNTVVSWSAAAYNTNYLKHTTVAGDINIAGAYKINPKLTYATGQIVFGETCTLNIYEYFD